MHGTLCRILSNDAVDNDGLLALGKPTLFASEPVGRLRWARGHEPVGEQPEDEGDEAVDEEQISPAGVAVEAAHLEQARREQRRDDVGEAHHGPEE